MNVKNSLIITVNVCFATVTLEETVRNQNVQGISILLPFKWLLPWGQDLQTLVVSCHNESDFVAKK